MPDLTPEAIDALIRTLNVLGIMDRSSDTEITDQAKDAMLLAADAIRALRGGQEAMRERAAQVVLQCHADDYWYRNHMAISPEMLAEAIRALPLDAPVPAVDPVADAMAQAIARGPNEAVKQARAVYVAAQGGPVDPVAEAVTVAIPRRLVPEVLGWMEDEIGSWPGDTQYQRDLEAARDALKSLAQEPRHE